MATRNTKATRPTYILQGTRLNGIVRVRAAVIERIREARIAEGVTQIAAAKRAGITNQYWCMIEMGQKAPSLEMLARMAKAVGVTVEYLVTVKFTENHRNGN